MNHSIKFIYFDIGDTLVADANSEIVMKVLNVSEDIFKKAFNASRLDMQKGILTPLDFLKSLNKQLNMSLEEGINRWDKALASLNAIESMHKLVKDLRSKYKIGLLTNIFKGHFGTSRKVPAFFFVLPQSPLVNIHECIVYFFSTQKSTYGCA